MVGLHLSQPAAGQHPAPNAPQIATASPDADATLRTVQIPDGWVGSLFAAEPMIANPVAFSINDRGEVYVCESFRQGKGVVDNRSFSDLWVDADLAANTIEDREKYFREQLGTQIDAYMAEDDRIRILIDQDHDGTADESIVFANQFNGLLDGTGAGVLEHEGSVFYTCIPNLYRLRDTDGDHVSDTRDILQTGYGVRVAFRGHDSHGLCIGPDGRLYFSIGDRGAHVETPTGTVANVESGSVFRCELDGSNLEIFATGLRNPQELAFDDYGNLFTGDNNSDSGDRARWVFVVEGADSGWRMAYQYLGDRGPFNRERIWEPLHEEQPAYIVPPIANIADGPSGLDYYPGTGFGSELSGQFFLADFRGTPNQSGIRSFRNEPKGAFFALVDERKPIWDLLATDVQFGPDGAIYVSDWVNGWEGEGKGRLYRFISVAEHDDPIVREVQSILASPVSDDPTEKLGNQLGHVDRRVRQRAQLELSKRNEFETLAAAASSSESVLARLHGMWGLEHLARLDDTQQARVIETLRPLVGHDHEEVRGHAIRLLSELGDTTSSHQVRAAISDPSDRVKYFALMAVAKLAISDAWNEVVTVLAENRGQDPILRHAGVMALASIASPEQNAALAQHASVDVRRAAVVALRRQKSAQVEAFLNDTNLLVTVEAARAIYDEPIPAALPALAKLIDKPFSDDALLRRIINANSRLGGSEQAAALARFAANFDASTDRRLEAIEILREWDSPSGRDRVLGMWRPIEPRNVDFVAQALRPVIAKFASADSHIRLAVGRMASQFKLEEGAPVLKALLAESDIPDDVRADALVALAEVQGEDAAEIVRSALASDAPELRAAALRVVRRAIPDEAVSILSARLDQGETVEQQAAITALADAAQPPESLLQVLRNWAHGKLPNELQLEALEAAERHRENDQVAELIAKVDANRDPDNPADFYREALHGGNARHGRQIFFEKVAVSCVRCHKVQNRGGEVGPELTRIAQDKTREYLLESIVDPNKSIAKGFNSVIVFDDRGRVYSGVLREETDTEITLIDAEGKVTKLNKESIDEQSPTKSAMPEDLITKLTKNELRDLVEFLASLDGQQASRWRR